MKEGHYGKGARVTSLKALVTDILLGRDFKVTERDGYLMARKGEVEAAFCLISAGEERLLPAYLDRFRDFRGKKVIVSLVPLPEIPPENLDSSMVIWDREALEREVGRMHLETLVGDRDRGLVDDLVADDYPKLVRAEELERMQATDLGERIIRPTIDIRDVKEIGVRTVGGFRHRLELVPHFAFNYTCDLFMDNAMVGTERGRLSVNALTKKVEAWPENLDVVYALEQGHRRLDPTVDKEAAKKLVKQEVVRRHTLEKEIVRDQGHVMVTEKRRLAPRQDDIILEDLGLYYLPIWCVEGIHGVMIINAGTGKIISEDYYKL